MNDVRTAGKSSRWTTARTRRRRRLFDAWFGFGFNWLLQFLHGFPQSFPNSKGCGMRHLAQVATVLLPLILAGGAGEAVAATYE